MVTSRTAGAAYTFLTLPAAARVLSAGASFTKVCCAWNAAKALRFLHIVCSDVESRLMQSRMMAPAAGFQKSEAARCRCPRSLLSGC